MDDILNALNGSNGLIIAILLIMITALVFVSAKLGIVKIKTDKLMVGNNMSEQERAIIRNQIEWTKNNIYSFEKQLPKLDTLDPYRTRYIFELVIDEITKWIVFNHIEDRDTYIETKQELVWGIIQQNTIKKEFSSEQFHKKVNNYIAGVIQRLISIRKEYD